MSTNDKQSDLEIKNSATNGAEAESAESIDTEDEQASRETNSMRKIIILSLLGILIIAGAIYGWDWYQYAQAHESTDNAQIEGHIGSVIPRVDGYVNEIYVDDNDRVVKGALLATIEKDKFELGVNQMKANVAAANAAYEDATARLSTAKAQEQQAQVALNQAQTEKDRQERLFNDQSATQQQFDNAKYALESAQAQYRVSRRQIKVAEVKGAEASANIEKAESNLEDAQLQLSYTELRAPIAGRVSKKSIEAGQYIRPGSPVMAIANDDDVWVVANFKEGQIAQIKAGQPVDIEVDAYPDTTFKGRVQSLGGATGSKFALLPPDNASGNFVKVEQRVPVKIVFDNPQGTDKPLKPGMNAIPTVQVGNHNS